MKRLIFVLIISIGFSPLAIAQKIADYIPGMTKEVEAKYTSISPDRKTISLVTDAQMMPGPGVKLDERDCKNLGGNPNGGVCIRVCGGGVTSDPTAWKFYWRLAGHGHDKPWDKCEGKGFGCRAFHEQYFANDGRACAKFLISRADPEGDRDLRIDISLTNPVPESQAVPEKTSGRHEVK